MIFNNPRRLFKSVMSVYDWILSISPELTAASLSLSGTAEVCVAIESLAFMVGVAEAIKATLLRVAPKR